jgi:hypothetical protein
MNGSTQDVRNSTGGSRSQQVKLAVKSTLSEGFRQLIETTHFLWTTELHGWRILRHQLTWLPRIVTIVSP